MTTQNAGGEKPPITPHKGDETGKRSERVEARVTPGIKRKLEAIKAELGYSAADILTLAVENLSNLLGEKK